MLTSPKSKLGVLGDNVVTAPAPSMGTLTSSPVVSTLRLPDLGPTTDGANPTWMSHDSFAGSTVAGLQSSIYDGSAKNSGLSVPTPSKTAGPASVFVMVTTWRGETSRVSTVPNERLVGAAVIVDVASARAAVMSPVASTARPSSPQRLSLLAKSSVPFDGRVRWAP